MPAVSSPITTTGQHIPATNIAQLGRYPGFAVCFPNVSALADAVAIERVNITNVSALWFNGQSVAIADESAQGVSRVWSESGQHARTAMLRPGVSLVLDADTSVVLFGSGTPSSGIGSNGDGYLNFSTGAYFKKSTGAWAQLGTVAIRAAARVAAPAYASTVTVDTDQYDAATIAAATGSMLVNLSGTPANHQTIKLELRQDATGGRAFTLGSMFLVPSGVASVPFDTVAGRSTLIVATYLASKAKWVLVSAMPGI